ncbi:MAG: ABC transporter permease subunit [Alphaproteobacteria bacterium]|jgi:ABC-2 type transport system permease protein|nr:ABC transporter permease subunit [Alphaproteobacteria bacterium]MDP6238423.1 ABC transporter permease subunit [Alphaproteobacteria bacterium]MDP7173583.1 ABC transporter permease subunit [Alphaproteobacteria bacterium]MDP7234696.1 ABC transporter permease subunit [Alphaproteobacteria bacterium]MDP7486733.1 ABC transporter permease subunit [Alphaproteobacteria bacterium]
MSTVMSIFRRELGGYFATPVAYVFIVIFLLLNGMFTFYMGNFYDRGQADLQPFFSWHPWLYLFLVPALGMRLWAEERRTGTLELLMTLPISVTQAVLGKFLAAWAFAAIALALTFPIWITVNYLGQPDNGLIVAGYFASLLMAGGFLAISSCISAMTKNQVIAFVVSVVVCFLFTVSGLPFVLDFFAGWAPQALVETIASFSFLGNFNDMMRGVIDLRHITYFVSLIAVWLFVNVIVVNNTKGV